MSQLRARKALNLYYSMPKTFYENFVNKRWQERNDIFEKKEKFINRVNAIWKSMTEEDKKQYMLKPLAERKSRITSFFQGKKSIKTPENASSSTSTRPPPIVSSQAVDVNVTQIETSANAIVAFKDRESYLNNKEMTFLKSAFSQMQIPFDQFFTDDIKNDKSFISCLKQFLYSWDKFHELKRQYHSGKTRDRITELSKNLKIVDNQIQTVKTTFLEICSFSERFQTPMSSFELSQTYMKKSASMTSLIVELGRLKDLIGNNDLLTSIKRRLKQQNKVINNLFVRNENEFIECYCENDTKLTWNMVENEIIDHQNSRTDLKTIDIEELSHAAAVFQDNIVSYESDINFPLTPEKIRKLVKLMPVIYLSKEKKSLFINLHEFLYTPGAFEMLFLREVIKNESECTIGDHNSDEIDVCQSRKGVGGQPSLVSKFPFIIDEVAEFVKQHGFAAQSRRRTEVGYSTGVTIKQIQNHIYSKYPEIENHKISLTTICRIFEAPNKGRRTSKRYTSYVNARVGTKGNSYRESHIDAHYLFARNKMRREMASLFSDEIGLISVDDMSKIKVGAPAVSRYHQIKRIFPENDQLNLNDHDFPVPGYLISVSGHMMLTNKDQEHPTLNENSCIYDEEKSTEPNLNNMTIEEVDGNHFEILCHQADLHLKIKMTSNEFKDAIKTEVEMHEQLLGTIKKEDFFLMIDNSITLECLNIILDAASAILKSSIVVFYINDEKAEFNIVNLCKQNKEAPLYILRSKDKSKLQFLRYNFLM